MKKNNLILQEKKKRSFLLSIFYYIIFLFILTGCQKKSEPKQVVVAQVGDFFITVEDFKRNYEFGLPHLKKDPDRKRSYLDYMIKEKLLSLQGYHEGMDQSARVQQLENELYEELLVEELFNKEVNDKIKISPEEVRGAITKSTVSWKLRYWVEPNEEYANSVCQVMRQRGYSAVVDEILASNPEVNLKPEKFESDYVTWLDVSQELLDGIKDLSLGEISDPVEMNGAFFIFQIMDIRRKPITEHQFAKKAESYRQILFYRQAQAEAVKYVSNFMTPKNVVTKGASFQKLANAIVEYKQHNKNKQKNFLCAVESASESEPFMSRLKKSLFQTLVTFKDGKWTIKDFLERFNVNYIQIETEDLKQFKNQLNDLIAIKVRNHFFMEEAKQKGLHKSTSVKNQLQEWRDKWTYEEMRKNLTADLKINELQTRAYFEKFSDKYKIRWDDKPKFSEFKNQVKRDTYINRAQLFLNQKIDSLKMIYPVIINQAVLDTITTIDSEKSRWMSLQVFKRSSNRMAVPIVDPAWGF